MMRQTRSSAARAVAPITPSPPPRKKQRVVKHAPSSSSSQPKVEQDTILALASNLTDTRKKVQKLISARIPNASNLKTKTGWCLVDGLTHCMRASNGILSNLIEKHGPPEFYCKYIESSGQMSTQGSDNDGYRSFRSLCRIVTGQQLAGSAAAAIWKRLLVVFCASKNGQSNLTPKGVLSIVENGDIEKDLRAPAGISKAKCKSIIALAEAFHEGELSDDFLYTASDVEISQKLQKVKGIGPWSVDMFLFFECHKKDILPINDLAVRRATAKLFNVKGKAKGGGLCEKKDKDLIESLHQPFAPYRSISTYYMYRIIDDMKTQ